MKKKYVVRLTDAERNQLSEVVKKQQGNSQKIRRAQILLQADENNLGWTDLQTDNSDVFGSTACGICQLEFTIISQSGR